MKLIHVINQEKYYERSQPNSIERSLYEACLEKSICDFFGLITLGSTAKEAAIYNDWYTEEECQEIVNKAKRFVKLGAFL